MRRASKHWVPKPLVAALSKPYSAFVASDSPFTSITPGTAEEVSFNLRGVAVTYDTKKQTLSCLDKTAAFPLEHGKIRLRMLVDRTSVDIFGNDGQLYMPLGVVMASDNKSLGVSAKGGEAQINSLEAYELKSAWK